MIAGTSVLVTGGAGFIGSHVAGRLLARGARVAVWDDLNDFYDPAIKRANLAALAEAGGGRFEFRLLDVADGAAVAAGFKGSRFDQVIHLAARAGVRPSLDAPALYARVNVEGTVNLLEGARAAGCRKFVLASSSSVYGGNTKLPFSEEDPISHPISPYAATKLSAEAFARVHHHLYGIDVVALRFFTVYGPRQRPDLAIHKFAALICEGRPVPMFGDGSSRRDYTFIDDIVDGVMASATGRFGCEVFNLGEAQTIRLDELIDALGEALGRRPVIQRLPEQPGDVPATFADISKARDRLGYDPSTPLKLGLERFAAWFLASRGLTGR